MINTPTLPKSTGFSVCIWYSRHGQGILKMIREGMFTHMNNHKTATSLLKYQPFNFSVLEMRLCQVLLITSDENSSHFSVCTKSSPTKYSDIFSASSLFKSSNTIIALEMKIENNITTSLSQNGNVPWLRSYSETKQYISHAAKGRVRSVN